MSAKPVPAELQNVDPPRESARDMKRSYIAGFVLSVGLTLVAYAFVYGHANGHFNAFSRDVLIGVVLALAIAQLLTQLSFFFHIDQERKPRLNVVMLGFASIVIFIIVAGSLWIMSNLNRNMTPSQMNKYLQSQDGL